ncbi:site-2 protease family protein [Salinispira pacifica]|uniref:Membrane protein, putative n=1 Tax=Salinispira pacifica TaxID=1307761 RepID=V5WE92_9SPIO|nr:site-2 protease family protein [Salinispira pacifica]AHC14118.1 membrane protein, putative [Salinispira pacifica]
MIFNLREAWVVLPGFIVGLTVHEFAHAFSASLLGDRYAQSKGRLTLNPLAHLSPLGTILILFLGFGYARPVPVNIYNFRNPRRDFLITSLAGPFSNIVLMFMFIAAFRLLPINNETTAMVVFLAAYANGILALINLLPIPPLDGSRIWPFLFPGVKLSGGKLSWIWIILLLLAIRLDVLNGMFETVLNVVSRLAGLG